MACPSWSVSLFAFFPFLAVFGGLLSSRFWFPSYLLTVLRELYSVATVAVMWLHYSAIICKASCSYSAYWCTRQFTAWHHVIWKRCAFQFPLCPAHLLSVLLLVVIWSYPEQGYNSATGHFVWLVQSPVIIIYSSLVSIANKVYYRYT